MAITNLALQNYYIFFEYANISCKKSFHSCVCQKKVVNLHAF